MANFRAKRNERFNNLSKVERQEKTLEAVDDIIALFSAYKLSKQK